MSEKQMGYTIAEGKFPKKPEYGNYLEICRKDFKRFKGTEETKVGGFSHDRIVPPIQLINDPKILINQEENLEGIKRLIKVGREDIAFSLFFQAFPTCLPSRSKR
ncbi:MAG: hypothetical protein ACW98X_14495 [Promethearchaeota archaeon]|jgi:hypothetical protein